MDPITILPIVASISSKCISTSIALQALQQRFSDASLTIAAICSESTIINTALSKLQVIFTDAASAAHRRFKSDPSLVNACDTSLTGCTLLYSCLEVEIGKLGDGTSSMRKLKLWQKTKVVWKEDRMRHLLQQMRGQATGLNLLLQCFHMYVAFFSRSLFRLMLTPSPC
jgi:hypothetical protein